MYLGYFDGASIKNPGKAAIGAYLTNGEGKVVWEISQCIGIKTNNEAEYMALIALLEEIKRQDIKEIKIFGDSQLVINQVTGSWRINHDHLHILCSQAQELMQGRRVSLAWIPREKNAYADRLSNQAFSAQARKSEFDPAKLDQVGDFIYIAHGTEDYAVDLLHGNCSCPAFKKYKGECKHLLAAQKIVKDTIHEEKV